MFKHMDIYGSLPPYKNTTVLNEVKRIEDGVRLCGIYICMFVPHTDRYPKLGVRYLFFRISNTLAGHKNCNGLHTIR